MRWNRPLTNHQANSLIETHNTSDYVCELMDGPIGPMVKIYIVAGNWKGQTHYCGGDYAAWLIEEKFFEAYPDFAQRAVMPDPEFDLEDMELAEIIMEELK